MSEKRKANTEMNGKIVKNNSNITHSAQPSEWVSLFLGVGEKNRTIITSAQIGIIIGAIVTVIVVH